MQPYARDRKFSQRWSKYYFLIEVTCSGNHWLPSFSDNGESNTDDEVVQHVEVFLQKEKKATNLTG